MGGESLFESSNQCMQSSSNLAIQVAVEGRGSVDIVPLFGEYKQIHDIGQTLEKAIQPPATQPACESFNQASRHP